MKRILVVEDEPAIAFGLQADLVAEGYDLAVVGDGETAARRAREGTFDLVLLDVMLPRKDGFEVCREVRRAGLKTSIILLTARSQEAEKAWGWSGAPTTTSPSPSALRSCAHASRPSCAARRARRSHPTASVTWRSTSRAASCAGRARRSTPRRSS